MSDGGGQEPFPPDVFVGLGQERQQPPQLKNIQFFEVRLPIRFVHLGRNDWRDFTEAWLPGLYEGKRPAIPS